MDRFIQWQKSPWGMAMPVWLIFLCVLQLVLSTSSFAENWIGIRSRGITADVARSLGLSTPQGVLVADVFAGSPAAKAGILTGDVITAINGNLVEDAQDLLNKIGGLSPNATAELTVVRERQKQTLAVIIGSTTLPLQRQVEAQVVTDCTSALAANVPSNPSIAALLQNPKLQAIAKKIAEDLGHEQVTASDINEPISSYARLIGEFRTRFYAQIRDMRSVESFKEFSVERSWIENGTERMLVSCFPDLYITLVKFKPRVLAARQAAEQEQAEARRHKADQVEGDRTRGYQPTSIETFVLDGRNLASKGAKVSLNGVYMREGNLDILYADVRAAMLDTRQGLHQPSVALLTDDAPRDFRQHLLICQSNPMSAQMGCSITVLGRVTTCTLSNALGSTRQEPCVDVEEGRE